MDVIPLETTDSCLLDDVALLEESEDYFFIYSEKTSQLYRFAKDGKNMKTISGKGQGPQEYLYIKRMMLDNESKELYIMDYFGRKMKIFSFEGFCIFLDYIVDTCSFRLLPKNVHDLNFCFCQSI